MLPCQSTARTIIVVRTFDFTTECFVERSQRVQGLFEKLRGFYLSAFVARQECFVSVIKPCALTRLGFRFRIVNILARKAYPIITAPVTFDCDRLDISFGFSVFMERKQCIYTVDFDTIIFKFVTRLREGHGVILLPRFDFRSTDFTGRQTCFAVFYVLKKCVL